MFQVRLFWIIWNREDASGLFFRFYGKCYFQNAAFVNLSWRVSIIFSLNFKTFFWQYMLPLYLPLQILLSNVFPKELSIWFVILVTGLRIIPPLLRHSEQVCSFVSGLLFSFPKKFTQWPTKLGWQDDCGPYFWHLQCLWNCCLWLTLFTVLRSGKDGRYGFKISWKHRRLTFVFSMLVRLIWFCETAKQSNSALSNCKRMT